jgi:hypothetical protein
MSSITFESNTLPELLSLRSQIDARVSVLCGGDSAVVAASSAAVGAKPKKPSARAGKPTAYGAFSSKIQKENADEIKAFKEANPEMKGAHMAWVGKYKEEHPEIYEAFKTEWAAANPKAEAPADEAAEDADGEAKPEKPKKVLSPEHLAKMKAGREAKKAAKDAEKEAAKSAEGSSDEAAGGGGGEPKPEKPKKVLSPEHLAKLKAGREAKKAAKDAEKAAAEAEAKGESPIALSPPAPAEAPVKAPKKPKEAKKAAPAPEAPAPVVAAPEPEAEKEAEALPFKLGGATYIRMGISKPDGNHEWLSGDLWFSKKGVRGPYAGELMEDGNINDDAEEPTLS